MLTDRELAAMQGDANDTLVDVCDIERVTKVSDGQGGRTTTWAVVHANVPCSIAPQQIQASERETADRITAQSSWVVTVPAATDVTVKDRVTTGSRTFEVLSVGGPRSWEIDRLLGCNEVT